MCTCINLGASSARSAETNIYSAAEVSILFGGWRLAAGGLRHVFSADFKRRHKFWGWRRSAADERYNLKAQLNGLFTYNYIKCNEPLMDLFLRLN